MKAKAMTPLKKIIYRGTVGLTSDQLVARHAKIVAETLAKLQRKRTDATSKLLKNLYWRRVQENDIQPGDLSLTNKRIRTDLHESNRIVEAHTKGLFRLDPKATKSELAYDIPLSPPLLWKQAGQPDLLLYEMKTIDGNARLVMIPAENEAVASPDRLIPERFRDGKDTDPAHWLVGGMLPNAATHLVENKLRNSPVARKVLAALQIEFEIRDTRIRREFAKWYSSSPETMRGILLCR